MNSLLRTLAVQIYGHQASSKKQLTICSANACTKVNTKVGMHKGWVSRSTAETSTTLGSINVCYFTDRFAARRGELSLALAQWIPRAHCSQSEKKPSAAPACMLALEKMPNSEYLEIFGARGAESIDQPLPVRYSDRQCTLSTSSQRLISMLI